MIPNMAPIVFHDEIEAAERMAKRKAQEEKMKEKLWQKNKQKPMKNDQRKF